MCHANSKKKKRNQNALKSNKKIMNIKTKSMKLNPLKYFNNIYK